jgi:hypothetical protein
MHGFCFAEDRGRRRTLGLNENALCEMRCCESGFKALIDVVRKEGIHPIAVPPRGRRNGIRVANAVGRVGSSKRLPKASGATGPRALGM